jgi:hypothetical protein
MGALAFTFYEKKENNRLRFRNFITASKLLFVFAQSAHEFIDGFT